MLIVDLRTLGQLSGAGHVKDLESFKDLLFTVCVLHFTSHHGKKFREVNVSIAVGINLHRYCIVKANRKF